MAQTSIKATCARCGKSCTQGTPKNRKARPFRRAKKGLCENCVVTQFLLCDDLEALRGGLLTNGIEVLKAPAIQTQFAKILDAGGSELSQWDLPFPKGYEPSKT